MQPIILNIPLECSVKILAQFAQAVAKLTVTPDTLGIKLTYHSTTAVKLW